MTVQQLPELRRTNKNPNPWAKVLVYAPARWGKTNLTRTCPKPLVLATELGDTRGLQTLGDLDIPYIEIDTIPMLYQVCGELSKVRGSVQYRGEQFSTVVVDSHSANGELWIEEGLRIKGWDMVWDGGPGGVPNKDPRSVYPYVAEKGRQTTKILMALEAHVLFLCREGLQEIGEGRDRVTFAAPELPGQKLPRELPGWPDATLHGIVRNNRRVLVTKTVARAVAGFRQPPSFDVPQEILPDMEAIFRLTVGDRTALDKLRIPSAGGQK